MQAGCVKVCIYQCKGDTETMSLFQICDRLIWGFSLKSISLQIFSKTQKRFKKMTDTPQKKLTKKIQSENKWMNDLMDSIYFHNIRALNSGNIELSFSCLREYSGDQSCVFLPLTLCFCFLSCVRSCGGILLSIISWEFSLVFWFLL